MDQAIKQKWVKALLSGEYAQGTYGLLKAGNGRYCCLGVLGEACLGLKEMPRHWLLPEHEKAAGLRGEDATELAKLNDSGVPFDMIAGLIDEAL